MAKPWTQEQAIFFCTLVEEVCPPFGCHVALTGGCLYKNDERKDIDILFYRIRQSPEIDVNGLMDRLSAFGVVQKKRHGKWLIKAEWNGRNIDIFFPEEDCYADIDTRDNVTYDE